MQGDFDAAFTNPFWTLVPAWITTRTKRRHRQRLERKLGKEASIHARLKNFPDQAPLPSLLTMNTVYS